MRKKRNMGNCLPVLFPNLFSSSDRSPLEEITDVSNGDSINSPRRPESEQSAYINELLALETSSETRQQEISADDAGKIHITAMLEQIPADIYREGKMGKIECPICMIDFVDCDQIRYLPCMHCYHKKCVDDWLMRSFSCPSCMEPVDSAMLSSFSALKLEGLGSLACSSVISNTHQKSSPS
ncbi:unnamed protein product [Thelazia callipaeda]|uniref:RING-type domain-containing protein n=1 Tax=Thelazia callipaeda TaxID=103827 RepID=A0A0N5D2C4_THECL|nr:unnamed protein product [Thelazia callipaeda]